jgi:hypothetical protein
MVKRATKVRLPWDDLESLHVTDIHDAKLHRTAGDQFEMTALRDLRPTKEGEKD